MSDIRDQFDQLSDSAKSGSDVTQLLISYQALASQLEDQKDKRREDWASTNKWLAGIFVAVFAIVMFTMGNLINRVDAFNREVRDTRDRNDKEILELNNRITVIETERRIENQNPHE